MTTLYRSPNVLIDDFEWHLAVIRRGGRVTPQYYYRPLIAQRRKWEPVCKWRTALPERFGSRFQTYRTHSKIAIAAEARREMLVATARERVAT